MIAKKKKVRVRTKRKIMIKKVASKKKGKVAFKITKQTHRGSRFAHPSSDWFKASNGISLESKCYMDWRAEDSTLYVKGSLRKKDSTVIYCSKQAFKRIQKAIEEYNNYVPRKMTKHERIIRKAGFGCYTEKVIKLVDAVLDDVDKRIKEKTRLIS